MGKLEETEKFCPKNRKEWKNWLEKNHEIGDAIWLIFNKKTSPNHNLTY